MVKYGDYEFKECLEGFVHVYIQAYKHPREAESAASYAVCYGENHPL